MRKVKDSDNHTGQYEDPKKILQGIIKFQQTHCTPGGGGRCKNTTYGLPAPLWVKTSTYKGSNHLRNIPVGNRGNINLEQGGRDRYDDYKKMVHICLSIATHYPNGQQKGYVLDLSRPYGRRWRIMVQPKPWNKVKEVQKGKHIKNTPYHATAAHYQDHQKCHPGLRNQGPDHN